MKKQVLYTVLLLCLASCNKATVASFSGNDFTDNRWHKNSIEAFSFSLEDDVAKGALAVNFSHIYQPGYTDVPVEVAITYPDGKEESFASHLRLTDASGKELSDCAGDICDLAMVVKDPVSLPHGRYRIRIKNIAKQPYLPNVLAVGVTIRKST